MPSLQVALSPAIVIAISEGLTPATQRQLLAPAIRSTARWAHLCRAFTLRKQAAALPTSGRKATELTVLHNWFANPIDAWIVPDDLVEWIHHNHLVPLVHCIRGDPIGIEHAKASTFATDALFSNATEVAASLDLVDTLVSRLSIHDALGNALLAATTLHTYTVDQIALFCLVAKLASLICTSWSRGAMNCWQLPELPRPDTLDKTHDI
mmetsp:Transcript_61958/g.98167  ORF Transcript_61958/g.98167 Transcript_61958/m.98167 type:complete len:209 (-) Transcript_61958:107-733(-)